MVFRRCSDDDLKKAVGRIPLQNTASVRASLPRAVADHCKQANGSEMLCYKLPNGQSEVGGWCPPRGARPSGKCGLWPGSTRGRFAPWAPPGAVLHPGRCSDGASKRPLGEFHCRTPLLCGLLCRELLQITASKPTAMKCSATSCRTGNLRSGDSVQMMFRWCSDGVQTVFR